MAKRFSVLDMMNEISREDAARTEGIEKVSVYDVQSNACNFYEYSRIDELKNSIYAMGGVRQNVLLVRNHELSGSPYRVVAGHRRIRACMELVQEGHKEFEYVPAVVLEDVDRDTEQMLLVMTNSTQREMTDWEKVMQHMRLKEIIPGLKKRQGIDGRTRELEADYLGVSEAQVAIYNTIGTKLDAWLMAAFKTGDIGISLAYEAARLEPEEQKKLVRIVTENGRFTEEDIRRLVNSRTVKGQPMISGETENMSESDTSAERHNDLVSDAAAVGNGVDSGHPAAGNREICYTNNRDDVDEAIYFAFRLNDFPEGRLQELFKVFREALDFTTACIAAENIFDRMLPYESEDVRIIYNMGYQVEYVHTEECVKIPLYDFWQGFEREFGQEWKETDQTMENVPESDTSGIDSGSKNVSESDTFNKYPEAGDEKQLKLRGGYELAMIDSQIRKYEGYLELLGNDGDLPRLVSEYNCLLDALGLLRERMAVERECGAYENDST